MKADKPCYVRYSTYLGDVDVMSAWYVKQVFTRHYHEGYGLGTIVSGAMKFLYRGENLTASKGLVNSVNPDEIHDGHAFNESGWLYNMLYFNEDVFCSAYREIADKHATPFIKEGVINDAELALDISEIAFAMLSGSKNKLYIESAVTSVFEKTIGRHTDKKPKEKKVYKLGSKLRSVREYIMDNLSSNISISQLSEIAGVSPYHFIRSFKADVGVAPYEYVSSLRASKAKNMVLSGAKYADVASECGYSDQSHMNRWLKKTYGITPKNMSSIVL